MEFELYLIKEFQRLKEEEQKQIGWSAKRELSKINYRIHTDAIKANLIPSEVTREQAVMKYADEADVLNIAMFGMTARQWREQNPDKKGNIRDYASINELISAQVRKSVDSPPGMLTEDHHHTVHEESQVCYSSHLRPKSLHL